MKTRIKMSFVTIKGMLRRTLMLTVLLILAAALIGCTAMIDDSGDVGIRGMITFVTISEDPASSLATVLVEGTPDENTGLVSDKASVTLTKDTVLVQGSEKKYLESADLNLLVVGQSVEIIFTGPVAESYPVQGGAKVIRLP